MPQKLGWDRTGGHAGTTEAAERAVVLAARYAARPRRVAETVSANCLLTQSDESIVAMTTAFNCVVALLVAGEKLDTELSGKLIARVGTGELPFHMVTGDGSRRLRPGDPDPPLAGKFGILEPTGHLMPHVFLNGSRIHSGPANNPRQRRSEGEFAGCDCSHFLVSGRLSRRDAIQLLRLSPSAALSSAKRR